MFELPFRKSCIKCQYSRPILGASRMSCLFTDYIAWLCHCTVRKVRGTLPVTMLASTQFDATNLTNPKWKKKFIAEKRRKKLPNGDGREDLENANVSIQRSAYFVYRKYSIDSNF